MAVCRCDRNNFDNRAVGTCVPGMVWEKAGKQNLVSAFKMRIKLEGKIT